MENTGPSQDEHRLRLSRREVLGTAGAIGMAASAASGAAAQQSGAPAGAAEPPSILYPHESATRSTRDLSGLWQFQLDRADEGEGQRWFDRLPAPRQISVPCSWNDLFDDAKDYFGAAWYMTEFQIDPAWQGRRIHLRFGSAVYRAKVWLNGRLLGEHVGGHLPFAFDITSAARLDRPNRLAVMVENRLALDRVPAIPDPATSRFTFEDYPQTTYDFFPYSGLHRPVLLFTTPSIHLRDVTVRTARSGAGGTVDVELAVSGGWSGPGRLVLSGADEPIAVPVTIANGAGRAAIRVPQARLWSPKDPFLYRLTVELGGPAPIDQYALDIGIRTIEVSGSRLLLNGEPIHLNGFGKHEDFPLHGRGLDLAALVRDFELMKWIGANSFRTSHYPYSEEAMMLADRLGFLVIDEGPGVSLVFGDPQPAIDARYRQLAQMFTELVARDKNHPSVIMWSLANEAITKAFHTTGDAPADAVPKGRRFFAALFDHVRTLDRTRPAAIVSVQNGPSEWAGLGDVICTNSYNGWYSVSGRLGDAEAVLEQEIATLRRAHGDKPIVFTEFGADAMEGIHAQPPEMWSEDYQAELIAMYLRVLARHDFVVGGHPWAFADFKTPQSIMRMGGLNRKGVFTRDRRPKLAAHRLRAIWKGPAA